MTYAEKTRAEGKTPYWGLAKYWLQVPVQDIRTKKPEELARLIKSREIYLVAWDWMLQFPAYHQKGKTELSQWDHKLRFPKGRLLPRTIKTIGVKGGLVHLTERVWPEDFPNINPSPSDTDIQD